MNPTQYPTDADHSDVTMNRAGNFGERIIYENRATRRITVPVRGLQLPSE